MEQTNNIPSDFYAGDKVEFEQSFSDIDVSLYTLKYVLLNASDKIEIDATEDTINSKYTVSLSSATTALYTSGEYKLYYILTETSSGDSQTFEYITIVIKDNILNLSNKDISSHNKKVLEAIKAVIENRASYDQMSYSIGGRSLTRMPIKDLLHFKDYYQALVTKELEEENRKAGVVVKKKNRIFVKLK
jgi:hypothetical protein